MTNYLNDSSFFMLVRLPGGTTGRYELADWFSTSNKSKYRLIVDQDINITAPAVDALSTEYPGVKFMILVSNPYRRVWNAYQSILEAVEDPKFKALFSNVPHDTLENFVMGLGADMPPRWPFWWTINTPQCHWANHGGVVVDYVLREEHLVEDFEPILEYFMRENDPITLTLSDEFLSQFTNEMKSKIETLFDEDFSYFGYKKLSQ